MPIHDRRCSPTPAASLAAGGWRSRSFRRRLAAPVKTAHVEAELVAAKTALVPGEPITVALRLTIEKGWHTYWRNPGDSGLPTTLAWKLPAGIAAGPIEWPAPRALPVGPLVNYGYEGEVLHLVELTAAARDCAMARTLVARRARRLARVQGSLHSRRRGPRRSRCRWRDGRDADPRWGAAIAATRAALPAPLAGWQRRAPRAAARRSS